MRGLDPFPVADLDIHCRRKRCGSGSRKGMDDAIYHAVDYVPLALMFQVGHSTLDRRPSFTAWLVYDDAFQP